MTIAANQLSLITGGVGASLADANAAKLAARRAIGQQLGGSTRRVTVDADDGEAVNGSSQVAGSFGFHQPSGHYLMGTFSGSYDGHNFTGLSTDYVHQVK